MTDARKVAIVTGAGAGIGRHTALALLEAGYCTVLAGRRVEKLQQTLELAGVHRDRGLSVVADVSSPDEVEQLFSATAAAFGRLDVLFNNAGVGAPPVSLEELSLNQWQKVLDVNLTGAFLCTRAAFRQMKRQEPQGGRIINNGSVSAHVPRPYSAPYTATKHGITGLTRSTSLDGRKYRIACGQIDIGNAATDMTRAMAKGVPQANGERAVEPTMDVAHVAEAVVYMAGLPLEANVQFMTVMATGMPYIGRG